ncbi:MAG: outer membrane protein transport protein [Deltaproteobacteria bacterium]|nr:outer membrane protein transport protein [Deltaproteobacteria bacterium]
MSVEAKLVLAFAIPIAWTAMTSSSHASVPDLLGFGARGRAMAGTLTATASGHEAVYYNPAGLARATGATFAAGFELTTFSMRLDGKAEEIPDALALDVGFAVPVPFVGVLRDRAVLGFGFVLPTASVLVADVPIPGEPRFVRVGSRAQTVSLMGSLGLRLFDELSVGVGFIALSELRGSIDVAPNETGDIGTTVRDELVADYAPILGALYSFGELSLGLTFRGESSAEFDLPITANLGDRFPLPIPTLDISGTAQYDPLELSFGICWRASDELALAISAEYSAWSAYPAPIAYTAVPEGFEVQPSPGFSDVVAVRAGAEWVTGSLAFRAGVAVDPSPVPTGSRGYLDSTQLIGSLGAGARVDVARIDLALSVHDFLGLTETLAPSVPGLPAPRLAGAAVTHQGLVVSSLVEVGVSL